MFGPPGVAYLYLVYGMHDCLNVVTEPDGRPAALLIRAVEPEEGIAVMRDARIERELARRPSLGAAGRERLVRRLATEPDSRLASGPGRVTAAFGLDRSQTGVDLLDPRSALRIESPPFSELIESMVTGPRVGVGYAGEPWASLAWRFAIADSPAVSSPRPPGPGASGSG